VPVQKRCTHQDYGITINFVFCVTTKHCTVQRQVCKKRRKTMREIYYFFLFYFTLLLHLIHIVCVQYAPSKLRVKVSDKWLLYIQLSCHGTFPSLLKYSTNWFLTSFPVSWWFLLFPLFSVAMLDGWLLKPTVTVPFSRSSMSKHSDVVYISGDVYTTSECYILLYPFTVHVVTFNIYYQPYALI